MSGCVDPNGLENCYLRGCPTGFDIAQLEPAICHASSTLERAAARIWPKLGWARFNNLLLKTTASLRPDVVWIFKGMEIVPATLGKLRVCGFTLVNYNADHPFRFFSRGTGNRNVLGSICEYHLHLTYSNRIAKELQERYPGLCVGVVPFGHEVDSATFQRIDGEEEVLRACFLGNPDEHRSRNIKRLVDAGVPVDVFGYRWDRYLKASPLLRLNEQVVGEAMLRTLRRYRVQLNFFRPHNIASHNMRTFEVPACGGIMLAEDSTEHRSFFNNGAEAFYFCSPVEMIEGARHLLCMSKSDAAAVRRAARERSMQSGYTYRDRARQALTEISALHARRQQVASI